MVCGCLLTADIVGGAMMSLRQLCKGLLELLQRLAIDIPGAAGGGC